jgi:thiol-disulfide isomerase/thioredoxin
MKIIKSYLLILLSVATVHVQAQHAIRGSFPVLAGQQVRLVGFEGLGIYSIDSTRVSDEGDFTLTYADQDSGMGYLAGEDIKAFFLVLANETIELQGEVLSMAESIVTVSGNQNKQFVSYAQEHRKREQVLSAWVYLQKIYQGDSLFTIHPLPQQAIATETQRLKQEDLDFLSSLDSDSYISWYLPVRKLVSSVGNVAQYRPEEIPASIAAFRSLDYRDPRLYKSGLLRDVIDSHFWLLENSGISLDSVFVEMNRSIEGIVENLLNEEEKLNKVSSYLFSLLEQRSLYTSSEYLALKLLDSKATLTPGFAARLESYRAMKTGNIAPDILLDKEILAPGYAGDDLPKKLSELKSKYTLVVFGASWCPKCTEEIPKIANYYSKWKQQDIEVVYVSLDENEQQFKSFASIFPFVSLGDYQKWASPMVKDYYVFATPTMYLLDDKREILLRPNSVSHLEAWVDMYLEQGNK